MSYKIGDKVICKKTNYSWNWFIRLLFFDKSYIFKKSETYYITGIDDNGIPDTLYFYTERECKENDIDIEKILSTNTNRFSHSAIAWDNNHKKTRNYFHKYFYSNTKEIRKYKLKKIFNFSKTI